VVAIGDPHRDCSVLGACYMTRGASNGHFCTCTRGVQFCWGKETPCKESEIENGNCPEEGDTGYYACNYGEGNCEGYGSPDKDDD